MILTNGIIVSEKELLYNKNIIIENHRIKEIVDKTKFNCNHSTEIIDCKGCYIMPGIIDIHSDVIENIIVPRKGIIFDTDLALNDVDQNLISQGITTIYHSISIANSTICNKKRTLSVDKMLSIGDSVSKLKNSLLINHKFHARLELNTIEAYNKIQYQLENGIIDELSFMNHAPGQGQYTNLDAFKKEIIKQYGNLSETDMGDIIKTCQKKEILSEEKINTLIYNAQLFNIPIAYHDVESEKQLLFMKESNINICEFPLTQYIAQQATKQGFYCLVGAPNIMKKKSHNNNASAIDLILNKCANIICSDYFTPALLASVFLLVNEYSVPLFEAVAYVSINPARAMKIDNDYGSIKAGKIADLIVVDVSNHLPRVIRSIINGETRMVLNYGKR